MNLHENKQLFADAILAASQSREDGGLGIKQVFLEKDYWITRSLKLLSESRDADSAVFKGGHIALQGVWTGGSLFRGYRHCHHPGRKQN